MFTIWVEFLTGDIEEVDTVDDVDEADRIVVEYRMAFRGCFRRIWHTKSKE